MTMIVTQAMFVELVSRTFLVVALLSGFQVWSSDGTSLLFFLDPASLNESGILDAPVICKGIASVGDYIYIGDSNGGITSVQLKGQQFEVLSYSTTISGTGRQVGIMCMHASDNLLSIGNEVGEVFCFEISNLSRTPTNFFVSQQTGFSTTSICCKGDAVVTAFSSGHIRIFRVSPDRVSQGSELVVEIAAHSSCINALALHPTKYSFASCGEDGKLLIWELESSGFKINLVYSELLPHKLLTGATFLQDCKLAVSAYDDDTVNVFQPSS